MRKYLLLFIILSVTNFSFDKPSGDIVIEIHNLRNTKGVVLISLFNNEDDFPENADNAVRKTKVEIVNGKATAIFKNLDFGTYAAAILHDENNNLKMDFNFIGIPKEGYGFSNNAKGTFGPPSFKKAAFTIDSKNKKIEIKATYF